MGAPGLDFEVVDLSVLLDSSKKGIALVQDVARKGEVGVPTKVKSWIEFQRKFMGQINLSDYNNTNLGPLLVKRALDGGAILIFSRTGHYTDPTDKATLEGDKASIIIQDVTTVAEAITGVDQTGGAGTNFFTVAGDLTAKFVTGITFAISGSTGNDGTFTVVSSVFGTSTDIVVAEVIADVTVDGNVDYSANYAIYEADAIGEGYNGITVENKLAESGTANLLDVFIGVPGFTELDETYRDQADAPTTVQITQFGQGSRQLNLLSVEGTIPVGTGTLVGGVQVIGDIVTTDRIGDKNAKTGNFSFDDTSEGVRISNPSVSDPILDIATISYAKSREIKAFTRTPLGLNEANVIDYRDGEGIYTHAAFDTYHGELWTGGLKINNADTNNVELDIPELGDALGKAAKRDKIAEWLSYSGPKRGIVSDGQGVVQNFGAASLSDAFGNIVDKGVNAIIEHESYGVVFWGNRTLQKARTLLQASNVADLVLSMRRLLRPLLESGMFDPNDPDLWSELYYKVKPALDEVAAQRGIRGGEGQGWIYLGDQNVDTVDDVVINTPDNLDNGEYIVHIFIKPIRATEFIKIKLVITNSGADFSVTQEQPPVV
jgi:hypothetical protein